MTTITEKSILTVNTLIKASVKKVWDCWTNPKHIVRWNNASNDWHTPKAEVDLRVGGRFLSRMEAKDGSMGFDFSGEYTRVDPLKHLEYTMDDDRTVQISFVSKGNETTVSESFEAENTNSLELQQLGWQSILENFKKYVENLTDQETLHFEISINAPVEKVYRTMLDEKTYSMWTSEFNPTSHYIGSWEPGSKMLFLGTDQNGNMGGMVCKIAENILNKLVSVEYIGVYEDGKEIYTGPKVDEWAGAFEDYIFIDDNGRTFLTINNGGVSSEFVSYFSESWPKALKKLKTICERS